MNDCVICGRPVAARPGLLRLLERARRSAPMCHRPQDKARCLDELAGRLAGSDAWAEVEVPRNEGRDEMRWRPVS